MSEELAQQLLLITGSRAASPEMLDYARRVVDCAKEKGWKIVVGDAELCPAIRPDILMERVERPKKADAARDKKPEPAAPKHDLKLEALLPYLDGKKTIVLAAESSSDLETAVNLANEFKLKFVLNHISHSQPVLDYVAGLKVPVLVGPIYEAPKDNERYDTVYSLPAQLYKRGVKIVFASYSAHNVRNLPDQAGFATAFGLPYDEALKAITINPAEVWGVADKLGSLDVGKTANVVVANGDPLDVKTDVKQVYIEGRPIPMTSRQTRLRDEYSK